MASSFFGALVSCFFGSQGSYRQRLSLSISYSYTAMLHDNFEEKKEPLVSPGRSFSPRLPRPSFTTAVRVMILSLPGSRARGRSALELVVTLRSKAPQGRNKQKNKGWPSEA